MTRKRARSQIRNEGDWAKQTLRSPKTTAGMAAPPAGSSCLTRCFRTEPGWRRMVAVRRPRRGGRTAAPEQAGPSAHSPPEAAPRRRGAAPLETAFDSTAGGFGQAFCSSAGRRTSREAGGDRSTDNVSVLNPASYPLPVFIIKDPAPFASNVCGNFRRRFLFCYTNF